MATSRGYKPPTWLLVIGAALTGCYIRNHFTVTKEIIRELPDPAIQLLERLNLTGTVTLLLDKLEKRRHRGRSPGQNLKGDLKAKHPVVMIPGIISCGLEVWEASECLGHEFFRERVWGSLSMARMVLGNLSCWLDHLSLDPKTGLDPEGAKVRAADGFDGADYFLPGYWLWAKFIESSAAIGYGPGSMLLACYDWRLQFRHLEERDGYFTWLRLQIEMMVKKAGHRAVVVGHSMGAVVWSYFMQWVSMTSGPDWVARHIHATVHLSGALLGAAGPAAGLLSGEMQATAALGILNKVIQSSRMTLNPWRTRDFLRTLGGLGSLIPKGGSSVWGSKENPTDAALDLVTMDGESMSFEELREFMRKSVAGQMPIIKGYNLSARPPPVLKLSASALDEATENPLRASLPVAPEMSVYCLYGVGIQTERAYWYHRNEAHAAAIESGLEDFGHIDYTHYDNSYQAGVATTDGDGTVPLLSLGYMCTGGWRDLPAFNPGRSPVHTREYRDEPGTFFEDPRGGPGTSKHVEILGNSEVIGDLLHIFAGKHDHVTEQDRIFSNITEISKRITQNLKAEFGDSVMHAPKESFWR